MELVNVNINDIEIFKKDFSLDDSFFESQFANSIEKFGLLQPIVVMKKSDKYLILDGLKRFKICKVFKYDTIPCVIVDKDVIDKSSVNQIILNLEFLKKPNNDFKLAEFIKDNDISKNDAYPGVMITHKSFKLYKDLFKWDWSEYHTKDELKKMFYKKTKKLF